jgi:serine protease Do
MYPLRKISRQQAPQYTARNQRRRNKNHPVLTIALAAVVGLGAGLGGSWFTMTHMGTSLAQHITYSTESTGTSKTTSVATSSTGTGLTEAQVAAKAAPSVVEIVTKISQHPMACSAES